jgi:hypothetical protein
MERAITIVLAVLLACAIGGVVYLSIHNPMETKQVALTERLDGIERVDVPYQKREVDVESVQKKLAAKPKLWDQLLDPPKAAAPTPPPPPPIEEMAKTLSFGRQQIGGKVMMTKTGEKKGSFIAVGETVNGLTIKEISKTNVVLSLIWQGQELTTSKERK